MTTLPKTLSVYNIDAGLPEKKAPDQQYDPNAMVRYEAAQIMRKTTASRFDLETLFLSMNRDDAVLKIRVVGNEADRFSVEISAATREADTPDIVAERFQKAFVEKGYATFVE